MMMRKLMPWYQFSRTELAKQLHTDFKTGLDAEEVLIRQERNGKNVFTQGKQKTILDKILAQLKSPLVIVLILAGLVTFMLGEFLDMTVILIALLINVVVGVAQEERASKAFGKLASSQEKHATVIRGGEKSLILAEDLVLGDIIEITAGSYIPADARLLSEQNLSVNEAALTGEWMGVSKEVTVIKKVVPITDQLNMVWMGTLATAGSGIATVVGIGDNTEIGVIAQSLRDGKEEATTLQKSMRHLARFISLVIIAVLIGIFILGLLRGHDIVEMLLVSIAIAVAAMPAGLPAAVTVVLALGMEAILKKNGLVRNLTAAETLGSTTTILTDKTGTLTMAEMRISSITTLESLDNEEKHIHDYDDDLDILKMAILTSDAFVEGKNEALSEWIVQGRPVERAIVLAGLESGLTQETLLETYPRLDFLPFESKTRFVASLHSIQSASKNRIFLTGAPELLLENSVSIYNNGKATKLSLKDRERLIRNQEKISSQGMRLIAVAYKDTKEVAFAKNDEELATKLVFGGFIVLHDPLREEVPEAIQTAKDAGTRVIMLTGDHATTALAVAIEAGIADERTKPFTGTDIEDMDDDTLQKALERTSVFARVLPHQKLRIAKLLKSNGEVVAMTGDGINDAPALRNADIGIALGSGTEVAKEASDLVLLDNSFSIILNAIEEGRRILDNLKKIVAYLVSTSFSEIILVAVSIIIGTPLPILPAQILWTNIIEEGFMNFAFAFEPKEADIMKRNPNDKRMKNILTPKLKKLIATVALVTGFVLVAIYLFLYFIIQVPIDELRTIMFIAVSIDSIFFALSIKNLHKPIWNIKIFSNKYLLFALFTSIAVLLIALFTPALQTLLSLTPISGEIILLLFGLGIVNLIIIELVKYMVFEREIRLAS